MSPPSSRLGRPLRVDGCGRIHVTTVRQLLDQKGREILSIDPSATVFDAVAKMAEKDVGSLVVMDNDEIVGMITERHYARNVVLKGKTSPATPISDIMQKKCSRGAAGTIRRGMYGHHDRQAHPPSARGRRRKTDRRHFDRRSRQEHRRRSEIHDWPA
jgi:hypothetical protein